MTDNDTQLSTDYEQREEKEISELVNEIQLCLSIAFQNTEYILGNADFEDADVNFEKVESLLDGMANMAEYVHSDEVENLSR